MSAQVLLNLLNEMGEKDIKCEACRVFYLLFATKNTRARMLDSIYHMTLK